MRHIATLALVAMLVVGAVPTVGLAAAGQYGTDAQHTIDLADGHAHGAHSSAAHDVTAGNATVTGYEIVDTTLAREEALRFRVSGEGEGSTAMVLALDGERYDLGTVTADGERVAFERAGGQSTIEIHCEGGYDSDDGWYLLCEIRFESIEAGTHDVGINGLEPTEISVEGASASDGNPTVTDFEVADRVVNPEERLRLTVRGSGDEPGSAPLALRVDGERHRLGTVSVTQDGASFEPDEHIPWPDIEIRCKGGYDYDDGWWFECEVEIEVELATVGTGSHDIGVNDLEPTRVEVEPAEARLAGYEVHNRTVEAGGTLRLNVSVEGESGAVPLVVTVDGEEYRAGTIHVEDGAVKRVETADTGATLINFVPCPDLQDDYPWIILCAYDIPSVAEGTHEAGVGDMETTEVTVESGSSGPFGGVLDDIGSFLSDLVRALGGFFGLDGDAE